MSFIKRLEQITSWKRVLNAARRTIGKEPLDKEPSNSWKAKILLAEHSPIRLLEYDWSWGNIKQWVTAHLVRHHEGCEKMVHSQRGDRRNLLEEFGVTSRDELPQGAENDMDMMANAQALINISRKRLCSCASKETREAWKQVIDEIRKIDPVLADKCVPECLYRGFCPEWMSSCGYVNTDKYKLDRVTYLRTDYEDNWTNLTSDYEISKFGTVRNIQTKEILPIKIKDGECFVNINDSLEKLDYLVAKTFIPNPENKTNILHKDNNKFNNQSSNLNWI